MITLTEVAKLSGVSASTVSNILNGKTNVSEQTKKRVLAIIEETGYEPNYFASRMRKLTTKLIGIIVEDLSIYTMPIVERAMATCEDEGYRTMLVNLRMYDKWNDSWYYDETKLVNVLKNAMSQMRSVKVDGIIYIGGHCRYLNIFNSFDDIPIVVAYAIAKDTMVPSIIIDDEKGAYEVTKYILSMGHKIIGIVAGAEENLHTQKRISGYQKALFEYGQLFNPDIIYYGNWTRQSGYVGAKEVLKLNPTALFCMNDYMAAGAYDYLRENNIRIPDDISVVGYDDVELSEYLIPKLTTCKIQSNEIGHVSAEKMIELINNPENEKPAGFYKIPCEMVLRSSVKQI